MHKTARFRLMDALFLCITLLPIAAGVVLYILTEPLSEGITVSGARIFFTIPMPLQDLPITESQVNSWLVLVSIFGLCLYLTHGVTKIPQSKRQLAAEWIVEKSQSFVNGNMGERFAGFAPFIAAIMALSAFSSLLSLFGLYPPTSDFNIVAGWAVLVFVLITHYKLKGGMGNYLKGFAEPIPVFAPFNVISEVATLISMTFRHYGNILSGTVISTLVMAGLQGLSSLLLSWLPGIFGDVPWLQIGIPAVLSVYFDLFSGCLQAFIFAMLTMLNISMGFPEEAFEKRQMKKEKCKQSKLPQRGIQEVNEHD